jgi:hypothetical protein
LVVTDGTTTIEIRAYLEGEHQYVADWRTARLFVRGLGTPGATATAAKRWPLGQLEISQEPRPSGARVSVDQAINVLEWLRTSDTQHLTREELPLTGDARDETWNFLRAIDIIDSDGRPIGRAALSVAAAQRDLDAIRAMVLRFQPVVRIVESAEKGLRTVGEIKEDIGISDRTFGAALGLAVAFGLIWRNGESVGSGRAFLSRETFRDWLISALADQTRVSALADRVCQDLRVSPVRFSEALTVLIEDPKFAGARGGSAEPNGLDARVFAVDEDGKICIQKLRVDDLLGLRSLTVRE